MVKSKTKRKVEFHLVQYEPNNDERSDPTIDNALRSDHIARILSGSDAKDISDVFILCHGWQTDLSNAEELYRNWVAQMEECTSGQTKLDEARASKGSPAKAEISRRTIVVGLHWPSKVNAATPSRTNTPNLRSGPGTSAKGRDSDYAGLIAKDQRGIPPVEELLQDIDREELLAQTTTASDVREQRFGLTTLHQVVETILLRPSLDTILGFPPGTAKKMLHAIPQFLAVKDKSKTSLKESFAEVWSFYRMRDRAKDFGRGGANALLAKLKKAASKDVKFHAVGHSFGCIVASAMICGARNDGSTAIPVHSLVLLQGAVSLWSYCRSNPTDFGRRGDFADTTKFVEGAFVSTQSMHDRAVTWWYPIAARLWEIGEEHDDATFPVFGALGTWGARGKGIKTFDDDVITDSTDYQFDPKVIYNIDCSSVMNDLKRDPKSGAHCDLLHDEIAYLIYHAAASNRKR